ncbi:MAG: transglycosylase SLT domain-containing protein [Gammaproteobacteria bacterium]|nr:MAG: transglycosylase SLT domain-containing protein [Gammaproteobacteria bacterium]
MPAIIRFLTALALLFAVNGGLTQADASREELKVQRERFLAARKALQQRDIERFRQIAQQLRDYPLYSYLEYMELRERLNRAGTDEIDRFLESWADQPVSKRLKQSWLYSLARQKRWQQFLEYYDGSSLVTLQCYALQARLETGDTKDIGADIIPLWLVGKSQADSCDPVFKYLYDKDLISDELRWERIRLAMQNNQPALAGWLARKLPATDASWVNLWREAHSNPSSTLKNPRLNMNKAIAHNIILHALRRLARFDPGHAHRIWESIRTGYSFTDTQRGSVERYIALSAAQQHLPEAYEWLLALPPEQQDERIRDWQLRAAIGNSDWAAVLDRFRNLPAEERAAEEWRYWHAVAEEKESSGPPPTELFARLARERSYHGFLAADYLRWPYEMGDRPLEVDPAALDRLGRKPGLVRARELYRVDMFSDARREWIYATQGMTPDELKQAAVLAGQWGWNERAILTVAQAGDYDDLKLRFPLEHEDSVRHYAKLKELEPGYVFAVIRQESAFNREARSPAGARGLMQLMPATGKQTARKNRIRWTGNSGLFEIDRNIQLGTSYLREVMDRYGDNPVLASASYNAGPHRVKRWLPGEDSRMADSWVATIPYRETRKYVQRVLAYNAIYDWRLELPLTRLEERMPTVFTEDHYAQSGS